MTELQIREATPDDARMCGRILFDAFEALATRHAFPIEAGTPEFADFQIRAMLATDGIYGLVAEREGHIVGSALQDERGKIVGIGPVAVDPAAPDAGAGRALMNALLERSEERDVAGIRLVQTAYNYRSFSLYAKLGFAVRELLTVFQGTPRGSAIPGAVVRPATPDDIAACDEICRQVHGHDRHGELQFWVNAGTARVVERGGRITGYATGFGYTCHAVGKADDDVIALLVGADEFTGLGFLVPSRNTRLMAWCFDAGLKIVQQSTLMTIGLYNEPQGAWLPSIGY
ncbi:GNAT family N-acetyltransferase [Rhodococcus pseudokoreensis]|uniref:GNAT family N-acetyltransferase n=1 Tax=Rhodococcus pseudokoreensis TaxID=2811421 RepID=A0A974ZYX8_9NOCA|nr:GNAT family N-acetyltransferase [Rhodococcus pseudokoreensis]QSE95172.1 GNAT family N-acetyltransferase [Rhodococcus pseudokoreensis]